jgi:hypothetical protein
MSSFKLIALLFPFVKEMILGEKTIREAIRTNKMRVFLIGLILLSFFLNLVVIPKLVKISADYVMLDRRYKDLEQKSSSSITHPNPRAQPEKKPSVTARSEPPTPEAPASALVISPAPSPPVSPPPLPPQDVPAPAVDVPPEPTRREKRRHPTPHARNEPQVSSSTKRYDEWKRTLDAIRVQQYREEHAEEVPSSERH